MMPSPHRESVQLVRQAFGSLEFFSPSSHCSPSSVMPLPQKAGSSASSIVGRADDAEGAEGAEEAKATDETDDATAQRKHCALSPSATHVSPLNAQNSDPPIAHSWPEHRRAIAEAADDAPMQRIQGRSLVCWHV